jgi:hypothetical protein
VARAAPAQQPQGAPAAAFAPEPAPVAATTPFYKRWFGMGGAAEQPAAVPAAPAAASTTAPPAQRGAAAPASGQRNVQGASQPQRTSELPALIRGAQPVLPEGLRAYTAFSTR